MERKREALHSNAYDNCKVYHPNGKLMFYCSLKRLNWYLKNDLAEKLDDTSIKLTFTPKGEGEPYDVVVMCRDHHNEYECYADELKMMLEEKYSDGCRGYNLDLKRAKSIYSLINMEDTNIPKERLNELENLLLDMCFEYDWDLNELETLTSLNPCESIIESLGVEKVILMWKDHFVNTIDTPYLPKTWDKNFVRKI